MLTENRTEGEDARDTIELVDVLAVALRLHLDGRVEVLEEQRVSHEASHHRGPYLNCLQGGGIGTVVDRDRDVVILDGCEVAGFFFRDEDDVATRELASTHCWLDGSLTPAARRLCPGRASGCSESS